MLRRRSDSSTFSQTDRLTKTEGVWNLRPTPSAAMRFFNVFGPRQDPTSPYSGVISAFLSRALAGMPLVVHGDGLLGERLKMYTKDPALALSKDWWKPVSFSLGSEK